MLDRFGLPGGSTPAQSRVAGDGSGSAGGPRSTAVLARAHQHRTRRRGTGRGDRPGGRASPGSRDDHGDADGRQEDQGGGVVKVLAAMSGGVDSAVAAARAV